MYIDTYSFKITNIDALVERKKCLKTGGTSLCNLPRMYYGIIKKDILNFEYGLIELLVSKDQMIPKIDGKSTLRSLIEVYGGSRAHDIIKKLITKSDSIENDKDSENNNLIASLLEGYAGLKAHYIIKKLITKSDSIEYDKDSCLEKYINEIIDALVEKGIKVDDENKSGETSLDLCSNLEILKILAKHASPKTLEKKLCYFFKSEEEGVDMDVIEFLLTEKKVKIDGFLDWKFSCPALKNNFTELVFQDDKIKESFLAQLSSSSSEQRDKFFEGLSEENLSLIKQELELIVEELKLKKQEQKDDKYGFKQWHSDHSLIINKNAQFLREVINGSDDKKNSFMEAHCSASPDQRDAFHSGLKS
jgi:hypothetical protein